MPVLRRRRLFNPYWALVVVMAIMVFAFQKWPPTSQPKVDSKSAPIVSQENQDNNSNQQDSPGIKTGQIKSGESFYDLMKKSAVTDAEILAIATASRKIFNLRKIKAGRAYQIILNPSGEPEMFKYDVDDQRELLLHRKPDGWTAKIEPIEYHVREQVVQGVIQDSLYLSLVEVCASSVLAISLADIFAWDIDFGLDLRKGDAFGILYEERWRDGRSISPGKILAARFINQGKTYNAVYYKDSHGHSDYYDADGHSLQKQFLKSPLQFKYISSHFSRNRLHPILKIRRPHLGVDYAAPRGTPVRAAADGRVIFIGREGGMGKMIKIRHNQIYTTAYGHLSRYANKLKTGEMVKQGEIIGSVGSTGLSTGPHLHYSFYRYGKLIDPISIKNPRAKSVHSTDLSSYITIAQRLLEQVEPPSYEKLTVFVDPSRF